MLINPPQSLIDQPNDASVLQELFCIASMLERESELCPKPSSLLLAI